MKIKKGFKLFLVTLVMMSMFAGTLFASGQEEMGKSTDPVQKIVTMAIPATWDTLMPQNTTSAYSDTILDLLFERLLVIRRDGTYEPRLAESYEVNDASDQVIYHLNKNAKWSDGVPVTAADVVFTAQVACHPDAGLIRKNRMIFFKGTDEYGAALPEDLGVTALDDYTVKFELKYPMPMDSIFALANRDLYIIPQHVLKDIEMKDISKADFFINPNVNSGPCILDSITPGERIEFKANKDYYLGAPDFDRLVVRVVSSTNMVAGLMSGDIDLNAGGNFASLPLKDWDLAKSQKNLACESLPSLGYQYMAINTSNGSFSQEVRQAINITINRKLIIEQLLKNEGEAALGPLSQSHKYFNKELLPVEYDVEKAKKIVENSDFDPSKEYIMLVPKGNAIRENSAPLIQQDLAKIGIKVKIQTFDFPTLLSTVRRGDYDFALIGSAGSLDPQESVALITVTDPCNFAHVSDPTLGKIAQEAMKSVDFDKRKALYDKYQMTLKEQAPMAWLYFSNCLYAHNNRLSNIHVEDFFANTCVWEWKVD